ncbi:MAG: hypothetical protein J6Y92_09060 [Lentisphaeria bacterium]|nr:hypothetical protein [Lentisphaeria bacterium]
MSRPAALKKTFCLLALAASLLASPCGLRADVFSIWPFGGGSAGKGGISDDLTAESAEDTLATLLDATQFWSEKVAVNGRNMTMKISMSDQPLSLVRASVLKLFPSAQVAGNESSLLMKRPLDDGSSQRIFLLHLRGLNPLLQFTTVLPKDMPRECPKELWPADFPVAAGAANFTLMSFPNRGSHFGTYEIAGSEIAPVMDDLTAKIRSAGWGPASMEHADLFEGAGDVFMKKDPDALLLLGIVRDSAGSVQVSFYTRKLK